MLQVRLILELGGWAVVDLADRSERKQLDNLMPLEVQRFIKRLRFNLLMPPGVQRFIQRLRLMIFSPARETFK